MSVKKNRFNKISFFLIGFIALIVGFFAYQHWQIEKRIDRSHFHGTLLNTPRPVSQFALSGIDDQPFTNENLKGQWTFLFFGFTHCGFVCPTTMAELAKMYQILKEKKVKPLPKIVLVSVDPKRDSQKKLNTFVKSFNPHFYGARGEEERIKAITKELGIAYAQVVLPGKEENKNYDIQHSAALILFNPQGELSAFFTTAHQASLLAEDYQLLVS